MSFPSKLQTLLKSNKTFYKLLRIKSFRIYLTKLFLTHLSIDFRLGSWEKHISNYSSYVSQEKNIKW